MYITTKTEKACLYLPYSAASGWLLKAQRIVDTLAVLRLCLSPHYNIIYIDTAKKVKLLLNDILLNNK